MNSSRVFGRGVRMPGGPARIGTDKPILPQDGEGPARRIRLRPFLIDPYAVTNRWFAEFVADTGFRTEAERFGWSLVFHLFLASGRDAPSQPSGPHWWRRIEGASWSMPEGPGSSISERLDHPVVHISWNDAQAFAAWAGGRLPTEAEWEHAAQGGQQGRFPWGDREPDDGFTPCNIWQGEFPHRNTGGDGFLGTSPVASFGPNGCGLYNMSGNVWEWCSDSFRIRSLHRDARQADAAARTEGKRVLKGGSYLCHRSYCYRYRIAARTGASTDSSTGHVGFRLAFDC